MNCKKGIRFFTWITIIALVSTGCATTKKTIEEEKQAGIDAMAEEDYEEAIAHFDASIEMAGGKVNRQVVDTCYYKAAAQYNMGKVDEAIKQYTAIMKYDENDPDPCFLRGSVYLKQQDKKKALQDYEEAIARDESNYEMYILIYRNLAAQGYQEEAEEFLQRALEIEGNKKENYLGRARVYMELDDYGNAKKQLKKLGKHLPDEAIALWGDIELSEGNYEKALSYYEKGLEDKNASNRQTLLKGEIVALEHLGRFDEAEEKLDEYLELYPEDADALREKTFLKTR